MKSDSTDHVFEYIDDMEYLKFDLSSLIECLGVMVVQNGKDGLIPTRVTTG